MVDSAQKSHVKVLLKQKWKLQRHLVRYQENLDFPTKKLSFDSEGARGAHEMIDRMMLGEDDVRNGGADDSSEEFSGSDSDENSKSKGRTPTRTVPWFGVGGGVESSARTRGSTTSAARSPEPTHFSSPGSGSGSPLSPISLTTPLKGREQEIAEECQKLLSRLIKVLERTDQPLRLLGFLKVDMALAIKVGGILASVLISRMKGLFTK
jgi:hypothetical protein